MVRAGPVHVGNLNTPSSRGFQGAMAITLVGDKELERAFLELEENLQKKYLRQALRAAFKPVLQGIRAAAPVDRGILKRNIKLKAAPRSRTTVGVRIVTGSAAELGIQEGKMVARTDEALRTGRGSSHRRVTRQKRSRGPGYYPAHVELGTKKMRARPYMRPVLAQLRQQVVVQLGLELWKRIDAEVAKAGRAADSAKGAA